MTVFDYDAYTCKVIAEGGWELRYSPKRRPYAALPNGFGGHEPGIKLHFAPMGGQVKVIGVIEHSEKVGVKRPYRMISIYSSPSQAALYIKNFLIPTYQDTWQLAQPKIKEWLNLQAERENLITRLRQTLKLNQHFDLQKGIEVLTGRNVEVIVNNDLTVALKLQVSREVASEILNLIGKSPHEGKQDAVPCQACEGTGVYRGLRCSLCDGQGWVLRGGGKA